MTFRETIKSNRFSAYTVIFFLFLLFLFVNSYKLGTIPAMVGDEGYEGLSVVDHIQNDKPYIQGRESYVSFWSDYIRLPFVNWLGPNALAMRIPFLVSSIIIFWLAFIVFRRIFGEPIDLFALAFLCFSPPFILYQRISWPIIFLPLFFFLFLFVLTGNSSFKPLLVGLVAGLGLATHMIFLAPLSAIVIIYTIVQRKKLSRFLSWWPSLVGFMAGFGIQLNVLTTFRVESARVGSWISIGDRFHDLFLTLLYYFSTSSYVGEYIGEFSKTWTRIILILLFSLVLFALIFKLRRRETWLWTAGIVITVIATAVIANYFRTRYLHVATLAFWSLAGIGLGKIIMLRIKNEKILSVIPLVCALALSFWTYTFVFRAYSATTGTAKNFPDSGSSWDTAGHFADTTPLVSCIIKNKATVFATEPKIRNRLMFMKHNNKQIRIIDVRKNAHWFIDYRKGPDVLNASLRRKDELCPELRNFIVVPNDEYEAPQANVKK
jgi:hypothetical protein